MNLKTNKKKEMPFTGKPLPIGYVRQWLNLHILGIQNS